MVQTGFANAIVTGFITGSIVALGAIGLALVYSIAEVPNFAHGELLTVGMYTALLVNKPGTVPVFELLTSGTQNVTVGGMAVLFLIAVGATLAIVYHIGDDAPFRGGWWPVTVPERAEPLAILLTGLIAVTLGVLVLLLMPNILGGMLLAALVMAAVAPLFETLIFRRFRERGADLATVLIVALGLSFVLRFSTQAFFSGSVRSYNVPGIATISGVDIPLSAAQFFDFYITDAGITVHLINTQAIGAGSAFESVTVVHFIWPIVGAIVLLPIAVAWGSYTWRRGTGEGFTSGQTIGPRLTAGIAWTVTTSVVILVLASPASVPDSFIEATRIGISLVRAVTAVIALGMMGFLHILLKQTKLGVAMRASSDNLDLAKVTGINTNRVMMATWIITGAYAAIGGVMLAILIPSIIPSRGFFMLLPMFAAVILGGVGSVYGAIIGAYVVGLSMDIGIFLLPISGVHRVSIAFLVLLVVLLVKPEGIMGAS